MRRDLRPMVRHREWREEMPHLSGDRNEGKHYDTPGKSRLMPARRDGQSGMKSKINASSPKIGVSSPKIGNRPQKVTPFRVWAALWILAGMVGGWAIGWHNPGLHGRGITALAWLPGSAVWGYIIALFSSAFLAPSAAAWLRKIRALGRRASQRRLRQ